MVSGSLRLGVVVFFSFLLTACGGGGGGGGGGGVSIDTPTCPAGQELQNDGSCKKIVVIADASACPAGEIRKNNACVCPPNMEKQGGGGCGCIDGYRPSADGGTCEIFTCSAGEVKQGAACVCAEGREGNSCDCKAGYRPNGNICEPFTCSVGEVKQGVACVCAEGREGNSCDCKAGYRPNGNICEPFTCSAGEVKQGFACVCAEGREGNSCDCKAGYRPNGNICEPFTCSAGEVKQGFACVCAEGREGNSCDCKAGYRPNGNICEPFTCSAGEVKQGFACVCAEGREGNSCDCKAGYRPNGNICEPFTCSAGEVKQGFACVCAEGREGNSCDCKAGYRPNGNICEPFTCSAGEVKQGFACVCAEGREGNSCDCKAGYRPNGNICEPFTCSAGEVKQGFACVCAEGREGNSCDCKAGYRPNGNICEPFTCPAGKTPQGQTCVCNPGTRPEGSGCIAFTCPPEKIAQGSVCVCRRGWKASGAVCIPEDYDSVANTRLEYQGNYGLESIKARDAYRQGYFGQGVTIGIADSGVITTHVEFGDRIVGGYNAVAGSVTSSIGDSSGHGTYVALVAAAGIGGNLANAFDLTRLPGDSPRRVQSGYFHGVAPAAAVMPLQFGNHQGSLSGSWEKLFDHAVRSKVPIVNNSWGGKRIYYWNYAGHGSTVYKVSLPHFSFNSTSYIRFLGTDIRRRTGNADMVYVWASGNDGWNYGGGSGANIENGGQTFRMCAYDSFSAATSDGPCGTSRSKNALATVRVTQQQLIENTRRFSGGSQLLSAAVSDLPTSSVHRNDPGGHGVVPLHEPSLLKKWLVVGAVNDRNQLASFSNGCGPAKMWCLVAPGSRLDIIGLSPFSLDMQTRSGTSFAAPHVSGALAVIKSAAPSMPMEAVRAVLLTTSRDLGARGIDDVFGWGIPDLGKAVSLAVAATMAGTALENLNLRGTKLELPSQWAHLQNRLQNTEVAAGIGVGAYYNTKLSDWTAIEAAKTAAKPGRAAADMFARSRRSRSGDENFFAATDKDSGRLVSAGAKWGAWSFRKRFCGDKECAPSVWKELSFRNNDSNWEDGEEIAPPFFAADGGDSPYRQFGMKWNRRGVLDYRAELSQVNENKSFWGANFGALGQAKTKTRLGVFSVGGDIAKRWRMRASYRRAEGGTTSAEGLLSQVSELRAETWSAALERRDIFRGGDSMRFLASRRSATRGRAELNVVRAEGDFTCGFYKRAMSAKEHVKLCGAAAPNLLSSRRVLDVGGGGGHTFAAAYAAPLNTSGKTRFALGAEYQSAPNTAAFSAELRVNL